MCLSMIVNVQLVFIATVFTILNPAPAIENLSPEFYSNSDIFCPNESEVGRK